MPAPACGSVTGAAAQLHLTHGAVSHQLRQLQDYLGLALFERSGPGLKLTTQGAASAAVGFPILKNVESDE